MIRAFLFTIFWFAALPVSADIAIATRNIRPGEVLRSVDVLMVRGTADEAFSDPNDVIGTEADEKMRLKLAKFDDLIRRRQEEVNTLPPASDGESSALTQQRETATKKLEQLTAARAKLQGKEEDELLANA